LPSFIPPQFEQLLERLQETRGSQKLDIPASLKGFLTTGAFEGSRPQEMVVTEEEEYVSMAENAIEMYMIMQGEQSSQIEQSPKQLQSQVFTQEASFTQESIQSEQTPKQLQESNQIEQSQESSQIEQSPKQSQGIFMQETSQTQQSQGEESSDLSDPPPPAGITSDEEKLLPIQKQRTK
jgi:hypothetical protein